MIDSVAEEFIRLILTLDDDPPGGLQRNNQNERIGLADGGLNF